MAVPLSPLSVTVTSRGAALGAGREETKDKKSHLHVSDYHPPTAPCLFSVYFCQMCAFLYLHASGEAEEKNKRLMINICAARPFISTFATFGRLVIILEKNE